MQIEVTVDGLAHRLDVDKEPTEADVQEIASSLRSSDAYTQHEQANKLPAGTLRALAGQESKFNPRAESGTGARGLLQFTHATGSQYGIDDTNWHDPETQITAGGAHMRKLLAQNNGDLREALKDYYGRGQHRKGDPTPDEYAAQVIDRIPQTGQTPAPQPAPGGLPMPPGLAGPGSAEAAEQAPPSAPPPASEGEGRVRSIVSQLFIKPAAHATAVLNRWGASMISTQEFNQFYASMGFDPKALPQDYQGLQSYAAPLVAFAPEVMGAGALAAGITGSHDIADGVEALYGGVQAVRAGIGLLARAPDAARKAYSVLRGLRRTAATSELAAEGATAATRAGMVEAASAEPSATHIATHELRDTLGLPEDIATPEEAAQLAGKALSATGRHRYGLLPGEDVGVHGLGARLAATTRSKFRLAQSFGKNVPVDPTNGDVLSLQRGAGQLLKMRGLTAPERELLDNLANLGGGKARMVKSAAIVTKHPTAPKDLSETMDLYAALRNAAGKPQDYPTLGARGPTRNAVYLLSNQLGDLIRSRTVAHPNPSAFEAWDAATKFVLEEQGPAQRALKATRGATTPTKALGTLLGKDSEPIERLVRNISPNQRELYQRGLGMQLTSRATQADGSVSGTAFKTMWNNLPVRTRQIIASVQPEAAAALNDVISGAATWGERAPVLNRGVENITRALDGLIAAQRQARQAPKAARVGAGAARSGMAVFARYHAIRAAFALSTGHAASAAYQAGVWLIMRHPDLFMSLVRSDAATPDQLRVLTAGLSAALAPLGQQEGPRATPGIPSAASSAMQP